MPRSNIRAARDAAPGSSFTTNYFAAPRRNPRGKPDPLQFSAVTGVAAGGTEAAEGAAPRVALDRGIQVGLAVAALVMCLAFVTADMAGDLDSPLYGMFALGSRIAAEPPGGRELPQRYVAQPTDTYDYSVKWDGEWQITYETFRDMGMAFAVAMLWTLHPLETESVTYIVRRAESLAGLLLLLTLYCSIRASQAASRTRGCGRANASRSSGEGVSPRSQRCTAAALAHNRRETAGEADGGHHVQLPVGLPLFVRRLEDDAPAFSAHHDLALIGEPAVLRKADGLTPAVLEEVCAPFHDTSLDSRRDGINPVTADATRLCLFSTWAGGP